jgi:hypothetical protein
MGEADDAGADDRDARSAAIRTMVEVYRMVERSHRVASAANGVFKLT